MKEGQLMADPLNILHTIGLDVLYPIVRCEIRFSSIINIERLKKAVKNIGLIIPEIFSYYQVQDNTFVSLPHNPDTIVTQNQDFSEDEARHLDFLKEPQLKIIVSGNKVVVFISHILTDGAGAKQFLYLLAACYNQRQLPPGVENHTDIDQIKSLLGSTKNIMNPQADHPKEALSLPKLQNSKSVGYEVIESQLTKSQVMKLHDKTRQIQVTLNDALMAAFGKTIQQYCGVPDIALACPTDMRQFLTEQAAKELRVQNMTARYNFDIVSPATEDVLLVVKKIHNQMKKLKESKQFLESIRSLIQEVDKGAYIGDLQKEVEQNYHVREIAYTNFGIINATKLKFVGLDIEDCFMTGSFRRMPMYQAAISTFNGKMTLAANVIGSGQERQFGKAILNHFKLMLVGLTY